MDVQKGVISEMDSTICDGWGEGSGLEVWDTECHTSETGISHDMVLIGRCMITDLIFFTCNNLKHVFGFN